jgi:hypothetical protein
MYLDLVSTRRAMAAKKDPASAAVEFFQSAPIESAQTVLNICKGIVARRSPAKARTRKSPATATPTEQATRRTE